MFGHKQRLIDDLLTRERLLRENVHKLEAIEQAKLNLQLDQFDKKSHYDSAAVVKLTADLRQMDQIIYQMGQCSSWNEMRPLFQQLQAMQEARMQQESNRMKAALIPAIVETYVNADTKSLLKPNLQIEKKS